MHDSRDTIEQFLDAAAARQPTPGGGSVAALVGALSAAMGEMVVNYSVGKRGLESHATALNAGLAEFNRARRLLLELMVEDQSAYQQLSELRKTSNMEAEIQAAAAVCIAVPEAIAAAAASMLDLADQLVDRVNVRLLSDLAVCVELAMATVRCAVHSVRVNLPELADTQRRFEAERTVGRVLSRAMIHVQRVAPRIWQRIAEQAKS